MATKLACSLSVIKYRFDALSSVKLNAVSNSVMADEGSHIIGSVESMNAFIASGRSEVWLVL